MEKQENNNLDISFYLEQRIKCGTSCFCLVGNGNSESTLNIFPLLLSKLVHTVIHKSLYSDGNFPQEQSTNYLLLTILGNNFASLNGKI